MARFANPTPATNDPSYLGLSKEPDRIKPNLAMGKLFEGVADIFSQAISGADEVVQKGIDDELRTALDQDRRSEIGRAEDTLRQQTGYTGFPAGGAPYGQSNGTDSTAPPNAELNSSTPFPRNGAYPGFPNAAPNDIPPPPNSVDENGVPRNTPPPPPAIDRQFQTLKEQEQANARGKFSHTGQYMNAESRISQMKAQWPGYSKYIDDKAKNILGYNPAEKRLADLTAQINANAQKADAEQRQYETWENSHAKYIEQVSPGWILKPLQEKMANQSWIKYKVGNVQARDAAIDSENKRLDYLARTGQHEDIPVQAQRNFSEYLAGNMATKMDGALNHLGFQNLNDVAEKAKTMLASGNADPKEIAQMNAMLAYAKDAYTKEARAWLRDNKIGSRSIGAIIKPEDIDKELNGQLKQIDNIAELINNKETGLASYNARMVAAQGDREHRRIIEGNKGLATIEQMRKIVGPEGMQESYLGDSKLKSTLKEGARWAIDTTHSAIGTKTPNPDTQQSWKVTDVAKSFEKYGLKYDGNSGAVLMQQIRTSILSPNMPKEVATEFAGSVFNDPKLLGAIAKEDVPAFLREYTSPEMTAKVKELSAGKPELWLGYRSFVDKAMSNALRQTATDIKEAQTGGFFYKEEQAGKIALTYNPTTNQIESKMPDPNEVMRERGPIMGMADNYQYDKIRNGIPKVNEMLAIQGAVVKADGGEVPVETMQFLQDMGIKVQAPEGGKLGKDAGVGDIGKKTGQPQVVPEAPALVDPQYLNPNPTEGVAKGLNGAAPPTNKFTPLGQQRSDATAPEAAQLASYAQPEARSLQDAAAIRAIDRQMEPDRQTKTPAGSVQSSVVKTLREGGLSNVAIAAALGHAQQESNFRTNAHNTDGENSYGLWQWNGPRQAAFRQFAAQIGGDINDPTVQAKFFLHEISTSETKAGEMLRNARTIEEAHAAMRAYERYSHVQSDPVRLNHGRRWLRELGA